MGNTESAQKLGERVITARRKLEEDKKAESSRSEYLKSKSPETMKVCLESIAESFKRCSPFLEPTLLISWSHDQKRCKEIILNACKNVLSAPIVKEEYLWFKTYVFPSSVWMFKTNQNRFMYEELMSISAAMSHDILNSMDGIYAHLQSHPAWKQLMDIKNETIISRQDDKRVGLLQEKGIRDICEAKDERSDDMQAFIDSNVAINILTTTAKTIDDEFQNHCKTVMNHYGDFQPGPMKKVERCVSKLENDYHDAQYPKSAKLLDLVRCSVTFNTIDQLITGYKALREYINKHSTMMELARVKNGFLDQNYEGGYRDIKLNVVFHSLINSGVSMICEIQLLLGQFLHEKKRIHKIYAIQRENTYFQMIVKEEDDNQHKKDMKDLQFTQVLNLARDVKLSWKGDAFRKCSVNTDLGLLGVESADKQRWFGVIDMDRKENIFEVQCNLTDNYGRHSHNWITVQDRKYVTLQTAPNIIKMFEVKRNKEFEEDKNLRISFGENDKINFCEFDRYFKNILLVINENMLEVRALDNIKKAKIRIILQQKVAQQSLKQLSLSNDGKWCLIAGGYLKNHFYLINLEKQIQYKLTSEFLTSTYAPTFINGESEMFAIGDSPNSHVEIWDVETRKSRKVLDVSANINTPIYCMHSTNNILAVGSKVDRMVRLYDVRNWKMFYSKTYRMVPFSIHLTSDSQYMTVAGNTGEKCVVLKIN
eukprot:1494_1